MSNQLIKIDEVTAIMGGFGEIVNRAEVSVSKCNDAGQTLLDTIEGNGEMNELLDKKTSEYLDKVKVTIKNMGERRKPITQIFDRIRSAFTAQEKSIDPKDISTIPGRLQKMRDEYAAKKYQEEQRRKQEAERLAKINTEKATYRRDVEEKMLAAFNSHVVMKKQALNRMYNELSLAEFERQTNLILLFSAEYTKETFISHSSVDAMTYFLDAETKAAIRKELMDGAFEKFKVQFKQEIEDAKAWCKDRFASKKQELTELEELRKKDAAAAAEAERLRQQREAEEAAKRAAEEAQKAELQRKELELKTQQAQMANLFDQTAATIAPVASNAKVKEKIKVLHPAGFLAIFNMWWLDEGANLPMDDLEKIFKKQITYCEKAANSKDQVHIDSNYIEYVDDVKAK